MGRVSEPVSKKTRDPRRIPDLGSDVLLALVAGVGALVMIGWFLDIAALKSIYPGWVTMKLATAFSFVVSAAVVHCASRIARGDRAWSQVLLPVLVLMLLLPMASFLVAATWGMDLGIEALFIREAAGAVQSVQPGTPSIMTVICFILIAAVGVAVMFAPAGNARLWRMVGAALVVAGGIALLGYALDMPVLYYYRYRVSTAMAWHAALLFMLLGAALWLKATGIDGNQARTAAVRIGTRLILLFAGITFVLTGFVALLTTQGASTSLRETIGNSYGIHAAEGASQIEILLRERIHEAEQLAASAPVLAAVRAANLGYEERSEADILARIRAIDEAWIAAGGQSAAAIEVGDSQLSRFLRQWAIAAPRRYGEIFVTDRRGAAIGMTATLTDYDQADEQWWTDAFADGRGAVFLDDRGVDESTGVIVIGVIVPVREGDSVAGVLKINYSIDALLALPLSDRLPERGRTFLARGEGTVIATVGAGEKLVVGEAELAAMQAVPSGWAEVHDNDHLRLRAHAKVPLAIHSRILAAGARPGISGERWEVLGWHVIIDAPSDLALAPLRVLQRLAGVVTAIALLLAALVAMATARSLSRPLRSLRDGAEMIAGGALTHRLTIESGDEIGELAAKFNFMAEALAAQMAALRESAQRLTRAQQVARMGFLDWNLRTNDVYWSEEVYELYGINPLEVKATLDLTMQLVHPDDRDFAQKALESAVQGASEYDIDHRILRPDGEVLWVHAQAELTRDADGNVHRLLGTVLDITERKRYEAELNRLATTDALTGLTNRTLLLDRIGHAIERASRSNASVVIMALDLDGFKQINDVGGHASGDAMLRLAASRLQGCVRSQDTVARVGGDEFVVVLEDPRDEEWVHRVVLRIGQEIAVPAEIQGRVLHAGASIGVAMYPLDGTEATQLLRNADVAMYHAKGLGGGVSHFFTQSLNERAARHVALRTDLEAALERAEFELYYQPIVECSDGRIVGAEALLRWRRAGTLVAPGEFLDVAEDTGLIVSIGAWVLREACVQAQAWQSRSAAAPYVSVNVSARQFHQGGLTGEVTAALMASGLPADRLVLELTESTVMRDLEGAAATLEEIAALGVQLAIDDFGTGHSSLAYLKRFPVRQLKIDQSFVQDAPTDSDDAGIVRAVIELGHALDLRVVAEGVETDEQAALLKALGCDLMQGYRFARPMPVREFEALLNRNPRAAEDVSE